ncbi:MAG TPA: hypothetical protein DCX03_02305 [Bacteroidales bacterium]|nr:hypothetical protein [Bacteroidales bacterium]
MTFINYTHYTMAEDLKRLKYILDKVSSLNSKPLRILEVGCGSGNICYQLAREGHYALGIDVDEGSIQQAKKDFQWKGLEYQQVAAEEIEPNRIFDVIICSEVLEHLYQPLPVMKTIGRMLANEGLFIVTVPNGRGPCELFVTRPVQWIKRNTKILWKILSFFKKSLGYKSFTVQSNNFSLEHVQFYTIRQLTQMAQKSELKIIDIHPACFLEKVFPFSLLTRHSSTLQKLDCHLADLLPLNFSSGFFITLVKDKKSS